MRAVVACSIVVAGMLGAAPALAQQYTWTGYGAGQYNCPRYKMTIDVTVAGNQVSGTFQQEGRAVRNWAPVAMDGGGNFQTTAKVQDGSMKVRGKITPAGGNVVLDGYCKFDAKQLTKK